MEFLSVTALEWLRQEYALHPAFEQEIEALIKAGGPALERIVVAQAVSFVPMSGLFQPILAKIVADGDAALQAKLFYWLQGYLQAQPNVHLGQLKAGLLSIEEVPS